MQDRIVWQAQRGVSFASEFLVREGHPSGTLLGNGIRALKTEHNPQAAY
jgi:hypothetical protein